MRWLPRSLSKAREHDIVADVEASRVELCSDRSLMGDEEVSVGETCSSPSFGRARTPKVNQSSRLRLRLKRRTRSNQSRDRSDISLIMFEKRISGGWASTLDTKTLLCFLCSPARTEICRSLHLCVSIDACVSTAPQMKKPSRAFVSREDLHRCFDVAQINWRRRFSVSESVCARAHWTRRGDVRPAASSSIACHRYGRESWSLPRLLFVLVSSHLVLSCLVVNCISCEGHLSLVALISPVS